MGARFIRAALVVGSIGSILIACGAASDGASDIPATDNPSSNDSSTSPGSGIGPAGGTVTENGVTVTIPAGALAASTPIHITESTATPAGYTVSGKVYHFEPNGTHFAAPITIALPSSKPEIVYWTVDGSEDVSNRSKPNSTKRPRSRRRRSRTSRAASSVHRAPGSRAW